MAPRVSVSEAVPNASQPASHPTALTWLKRVWKGMDKARTTGLAAEMAFWLFLSILPLAAVAGLVVARLAVANRDIAAPLLSSLPPASAELLSRELSNVAAWNGGAVAPLAAVVFVWLASSGIHSVFDAIEVQTDTPARPWWKKRLLSIGCCVAISIGLAAVALLGAGADVVVKLVGREGVSDALAFVQWSFVGKIVRFLVGLAIVLGLLSGLYWLGTRHAAKRPPILPGALLALGLEVALAYGYGAYVKIAGDGNAYQAGLAVIGVTLMALYLFCVAVLVGAEFNQAISEQRRS